ncbi:MAG: SMC family ATPase, partial [Candidatus Aenigmarchaeota archaeon]|nr:SMC family ATPase [Candidatus Aenigmarchaeota archaeon]
MMLKSLRLRNIRSYIDEKIEFPAGSTLLSGDIGSGKSTVLMAIDFALFGLKRGELQGADLLRHGKNDGFVELAFEVNGKTFSIKRALKRGKSILQDTGSISIDGCEYDLGPSELKAMVMDIVGYSDPKKPVFRYTVYTPQEEMKSILITHETRMEVLRNVFDIDKYIRIKNSSKILLSEIRAMKRESDAFSRDISEKQRLLESYKSEAESANAELSVANEKLHSLDKKYSETKQSLDSMKEQHKEAIKIRTLLEKKRADLANAESGHAKLLSEIGEISKKIGESAAALEGYEKIDIFALKKRSDELEMKKEKILMRKSGVSKEKDSIEGILRRGICNVCGQEVSNPESFRKRIESLSAEIAGLEEEMKNSTEEIPRIRDIMLKFHRLESAEKSRDDYKRWLERFVHDKDELEKTIASLKSDVNMLEPKLEEYGMIEKQIRLAENNIYMLQNERVSAERMKSRLEQKKEGLLSSIERLVREIKEKN